MGEMLQAVGNGTRTTIAEPAEILDALATLARSGGNLSRTSRQTGLPRKTLRVWRETHQEEYTALSQRFAQELEGRLVSEYREVTLASTEAARLAVQRAHELLQRDEDKQPSSTAQRLATTAGILTDKTLTLEGRPTSIHAASSLDEDLRWLRSRAIDGEATEEETASPNASSDQDAT